MQSFLRYMLSTNREKLIILLSDNTFRFESCKFFSDSSNRHFTVTIEIGDLVITGDFEQLAKQISLLFPLYPRKLMIVVKKFYPMKSIFIDSGESSSVRERSILDS